MKNNAYQKKLLNKIEQKKNRLDSLDEEMNKRLSEINNLISKIMGGRHPSEVFGRHPSLNQGRIDFSSAAKIRSCQDMFDQVKESYKEEEKDLVFEINELKQKFRDSESPIFNGTDLSTKGILTSGECFFISYKSEDVVIARNIAEGLMLLGHEVWFAEYQILNEKYFDFKGEILKGVKKSTKAICIINERYSKSIYCVEFELKPLLENIGDKNIAVITTEGWPIYNDQLPKFNPAFIIAWKGIYNDVFETLKLNGFTSRIPSNYLDFKHSISFKRFKFDGLGIAFDSSGWLPIRRDGQSNTYIRKMGDLDIGVHVNWHTLTNENQEEEQFRSTGIDDRKIFEFNVKGTKKYIRKSKRWFNRVVLL